MARGFHEYKSYSGGPRNRAGGGDKHDPHPIDLYGRTRIRYEQIDNGISGPTAAEEKRAGRFIATNENSFEQRETLDPLRSTLQPLGAIFGDDREVFHKGLVLEES